MRNNAYRLLQYADLMEFGERNLLRQNSQDPRKTVHPFLCQVLEQN